MNFNGLLGWLGLGDGNALGCEQQRKYDAFDPFHSQNPPCDISFSSSHYGAKYWSSSFSSCRESRARVRICMTIVPVILGEMAIGGVWQREQLLLNTCSPVFGVCGF
jgi:hypothetical protein